MAAEPDASEPAVDPGVQVVLPFKDVSLAKSRLAEVPAALRGRIAQAMLVHAVRTWTAIAAEVVVISGSPGLAGFLSSNGLQPRVLPDPGAGLNAAFRAGAAEARPDDLVVATMADLPALRVTDLTRTLGSIPHTPGRWFVPDAEGTGTTLLAVRGRSLDPVFGRDSAARHRGSGAVELDAPAGLRRDVDTLADLSAALGSGAPSPELAALVEDGRPVRHQTAVIAEATGEGLRLLLDDGTAVIAGPAALPPDLPHPRWGQRVHVARSAEGAVRQLWI